MTNLEHAVEYEYGYPLGIRCGWAELRRLILSEGSEPFYIVDTIIPIGRIVSKAFDASHRLEAWLYFRKLARNL
ncbi:MAG TPA: hypothetical protein VM163_13990 [bacterium]|nr:hypothetical protein [bacterium]